MNYRRHCSHPLGLFRAVNYEASCLKRSILYEVKLRTVHCRIL